MPKAIPFFSIITVVRNDLDGLQQTLKSIIAQTNRNFEWIVIDGASSDGCLEFLESLNFEKLRWISEPDTGIYEAMNKGISRIKGKYVVFLNAGDLFPNETILDSVQKKITEKNKLIDVLFGGAMLILPNGKSVYRAPKEMTSYIWHGLPSIHQATYYRSKLLENNNYDESYRISGDYFIIAQLYSLGITSLLYDKSLVNFRVGDLSFKNPYKLFIESYKVQKDILKIGFGNRCLSFIKKIISYTALFLLVNNLISRDFVKLLSGKK